MRINSRFMSESPDGNSSANCRFSAGISSPAIFPRDSVTDKDGAPTAEADATGAGAAEPVELTEPTEPTEPEASSTEE